jgi:2-phospho-L-lactate transferase/gluconeogenesis factor (CofD/UPF0052 family)
MSPKTMESGTIFAMDATTLDRAAGALSRSAHQNKADPRLSLVLFSGGSGTGTIAGALLRQPRVDLTIVINAYDDGHSTGRLRRFIPGMLGPSDVRKNINRLMPHSQERHSALRILSDHRLPAGCQFDAGMRLVECAAAGLEPDLPPALLPNFDLLSVLQARIFQQFFRRFLEYAEAEAAKENRFDFDDCALGNILFAGCFLEEEHDFNRAISSFSRFFEITGRIINVTRGENLFLMASAEDGEFIRGEADLVSREARSAIRDLYLIDERIYRDQIEPAKDLSQADFERLVSLGARTPKINPEARLAIESADLIVYGPGTQHSSLLPSYLTEGVGEAIARNTGTDKVFISNIRRDVDIQHEDASALARKFLMALSRNGHIKVGWNEVVTHFFFQGDESGTVREGYVPFNYEGFEFPMSTVTVRDWESHDGKHAGGYVTRELARLVQVRLGAVLEGSPDLVSIVVPGINEEGRVGEALRRLTAMDFSAFDLGREIIFVDGGSTDKTLEIAQSVPGVKTYQLQKRYGRGAALRLGIERARGDLIVFFPSDLEYSEDDIHNVVFSIVRNHFKVVFGTRAAKCSDLSSALKTVYGGNRLAYFVSKYGGMLLSTVTLFLYNRYVTDTLTSIKGFDAKFLRSLRLVSSGMDLDAEIVAKVCRRQEYILEVPVEYSARTKAEGKKSTTRQGIKTLWALFRWRFSSFV